MRMALTLLVLGFAGFAVAQTTYNGGLALSPDGRTLAVSDCGDTVRLYRVADGRLVRGFSAPNDNFPGLFVQPAFSPNGRYLTAGNLAPDGGLNPVWRVSSGKVVAELAVWADATSPAAMSVIGFSGDGKYVLGSLYGYGSQQVRVAFRTSQWQLAFLSDSIESTVVSQRMIVSPSPRGTFLACLGNDLDRWHPLQLTNEWGVWPVSTPPGTEYSSFSGDGHVLMMAGDGWVASIDYRNLPKEGEIESYEPRKTSTVPGFVVRSLAAKSNGKEAFIGSRDGRIVRFDLAANKAIRTWKAFTKPVKGLAVSRDGSKLFATDLETIQIWNLRTGALTRSFPKVQKKA
jgi:WD40 repeat protein